MDDADPTNSNTGKLVVVGLFVVPLLLFLLFLPGATERLLDRLGKLVPVLIVLCTAGIAFLVVRTLRKR